jgi:hypothetical protein
VVTTQVNGRALPGESIIGQAASTPFIAGSQLLGGSSHQPPHTARGDLQAAGDYRRGESLLPETLKQAAVRRGNGSRHGIILDENLIA